MAGSRKIGGGKMASEIDAEKGLNCGKMAVLRLIRALFP